MGVILFHGLTVVVVNQRFLEMALRVRVGGRNDESRIRYETVGMLWIVRIKTLVEPFQMSGIGRVWVCGEVKGLTLDVGIEHDG